MADPRQLLRTLIELISDPWMDRQPGWLGDYSQTVITDAAGVYNVRVTNGDVVQAYNYARVRPDYDVPVEIGHHKDSPTVWQIIKSRKVYVDDPNEGTLQYHHKQHEEDGPDRVDLDIKQTLQFTVRVYDSAGFIVKVGGRVAPSASGLMQIATQLVDLSDYVGTASACFVTIETDDTGTLSTQQGTDFGAPSVANIIYVPAPAPGKYTLAYILISEAYTVLLDAHIRVVTPIALISKNTGLQIHEAAAATPGDTDEFGFWDVTHSLLKKITWANIKATLKTYFDTLYAAISHTHSLDTEGIQDIVGGMVSGNTEMGIDVSYNDASGTLDFSVTLPAGHVHGLARWNGASGQTTFDLPDLWEVVDSLIINGLEEDPANYSLSSARTQIILDTALPSAYAVWANGVIAQV